MIGSKIPEKWYIAIKDQKGFMTPYGTDKAAEKRIYTVDHWAGNRSGKPYDSIIQNGFKIVGVISRGGSSRGSDDRWVVRDPRGFELEISASNLLSILPYVTIENGLIKESCIWARQGNSNVLIPTNCPAYKNSLVNTEISNKDIIPFNTVPIGSLVTLKNGEKYYYMGKIKFTHSVFSHFVDKNGNTVPNTYIWKTNIYKIIEDSGYLFSEVEKKYKEYKLIKTKPKVVDFSKTDTIDVEKGFDKLKESLKEYYAYMDRYEDWYNSGGKTDQKKYVGDYVFNPIESVAYYDNFKLISSNDTKD